jgi:hypothetical protein
MNLEDGYLGSGKFLGNSIAKYGRKNHEREILEFFDDKKDAFVKENEIVNEEMLKDSQCMNLKRGGEGGLHLKDKEALQKILLASKEAFRKNCKDGKHREHFSSLGKKNHALGKIRPPDWTGKKHSEETKQKIGEVQRKLRKEDNSQFGTCWIHKDSICKKISITDFQIYQNEGWKRGRLGNGWKSKISKQKSNAIQEIIKILKNEI